MAVGTPVLTTELGVAGLSLTDSKTILTAETVEEIAKKALQLLKDEKLYQTVSQNSRIHVEKNFSFDAIAEKLDRIYYQVVKK